MAENIYIKEALDALKIKRQEAQWIIDEAAGQATALQTRNAPKVLAAREQLVQIDEALTEFLAVQEKLADAKIIE